MIKLGKKGIRTVVKSLSKVVSGITGANLVNKVGKKSQKVLNNLGKFVTRIPIAGGLFAYVFVQTGKGLVIITTTADKLVDSSGKIINSALNGAGDLSVWVLDTISGATSKVGKTLRLTKRRGRKARRTRKKSKKGKKKAGKSRRRR
tara:strand:+ start:202 stop:642 length:441 start_codon:yes stop_codon:yes gene_type:complete